MIKYGWALVISLAIPMPAFGQHPCDTTPPTVYREPSGQLAKLKLGFCFAKQDTDGQPIDQAIGFSLQINGGPDIDLGTLAPMTEPNAVGLQYYETQTPLLAAGVLTLKAYTADAQSAASGSITLTLLGNPKPPTKVSVKP